MKSKSGLLVPKQKAPTLYKSEKSGCAKRRRRSLADVKHCVCGLKVKTRHGETRCPKHGTAWAPECWELTKVAVG